MMLLTLAIVLLCSSSNAAHFSPGFGSAAGGLMLEPRLMPLSSRRLSNFVCFSYSKAAPDPPSPRFIHFLQENVNVNANFLPKYGSFEVTKAGIYAFHFSFMTSHDQAAIVSLRRNGRILASALSEGGGHSAVSQSALAALHHGDVVQLEVIEGRVHESSRPEFAYTTFSGWLLAGAGDENDDEVPQPKRRHDYRYCSKEEESWPPLQPPYRPPQPPPEATSPSRPPHIYTTTARPPSHPGGRAPPYCCDQLIMTTSSAAVAEKQREKLGVYRLVSTEDSRHARGIFKHCENEVFLYYYESPQGWYGWMAGPQVGVGRGGFLLESRSVCVEDGDDLASISWHFYNGRDFQPDEGTSLACFVPGEIARNDPVGNATQHQHYHHHEHYYPENKSEHARSILSPPGPAYQVQSNRDYVEATFVFPNKQSPSDEATVLEAREAVIA